MGPVVIPVPLSGHPPRRHCASLSSRASSASRVPERSSSPELGLNGTPVPGLRLPLARSPIPRDELGASSPHGPMEAKAIPQDSHPLVPGIHAWSCPRGCDWPPECLPGSQRLRVESHRARVTRRRPRFPDPQVGTRLGRPCLGLPVLGRRRSPLRVSPDVEPGPTLPTRPLDGGIRGDRTWRADVGRPPPLRAEGVRSHCGHGARIGYLEGCRHERGPNGLIPVSPRRRCW